MKFVEIIVFPYIVSALIHLPQQKFSLLILHITFEPIKILTRLATQNDRQDLSFVQDNYVEGGKVAK